MQDRYCRERRVRRARQAGGAADGLCTKAGCESLPPSLHFSETGRRGKRSGVYENLDSSPNLTKKSGNSNLGIHKICNVIFPGTGAITHFRQSLAKSKSGRKAGLGPYQNNQSCFDRIKQSESAIFRFALPCPLA